MSTPSVTTASNEATYIDHLPDKKYYDDALAAFIKNEAATYDGTLGPETPLSFPACACTGWAMCPEHHADTMRSYFAQGWCRAAITVFEKKIPEDLVLANPELAGRTYLHGQVNRNSLASTADFFKHAVNVELNLAVSADEEVKHAVQVARNVMEEGVALECVRLILETEVILGETKLQWRVRQSMLGETVVAMVHHVTRRRAGGKPDLRVEIYESSAKTWHLA